jgi:hypothetical protein
MRLQTHGSGPLSLRRAAIRVFDSQIRASQPQWQQQSARFTAGIAARRSADHKPTASSSSSSSSSDSNVASESTSLPPSELDIGILGGGITGLAAAYYAVKAHAEKYPGQQLPRITLYEKSKKLGGWMKSSKVRVPEGEVLFEWGPRSIRPGSAGGLLVLDLVSICCLSNFDFYSRQLAG